MKPWTEEFAVPFELQAADGDEGTFRGMAVMFGSLIDAFVPTRIKHGAFKKTLRENAKSVKILFHHDRTKPIGVPISMSETVEGLELHAELGGSTLAQDVRQDLKPLPISGRAVLDSLSIGFDPMKSEMLVEELPVSKGSRKLEKVQVRHLSEIRLHEVSVVTWGSDSKAKVTQAFSLPYADLPVGALELPYDLLGAQARLEEWTNANPDEVAEKAFVLRAPEGRSIQIADVIDGQLVVVPQMVFAAAQTLCLVDGDTDPAELLALQGHVGRYYEKLGRVAPWDSRRSFMALTLESYLSRELDGKTAETLSDSDQEVMREAANALNTFDSESNEPPADEAEPETQALDDDDAIDIRERELALEFES